MGFPRQEYWSGFPFPPPGDLPNPGIESGSTVLEADSSPTEPAGKPKRSQEGCKGSNCLKCVQEPVSRMLARLVIGSDCCLLRLFGA